MIEEDFKTFLEEQLEKIVDKNSLLEYCSFIQNVRMCSTKKCPISSVCGKFKYSSTWINSVLNDLNIIKRKAKLKKLLK